MTAAPETAVRTGIASGYLKASLPIICFIASGLVSLLLGQDSNWDLKNYHFYNAYAFIHDRLLYDVAPAQLQTFHNPLMDIPVYLLIQSCSPMAVGFLIGGLQGFNIWLAYKIAFHLLQDIPGRSRHILSFATGITGYLGTANLSEIGTTFGDNITSLFVLAALLLLIRAMPQQPGEKVGFTQKSVLLSGLLLGMGAGLKLVVGVYGAAFLLSLLLLSTTWQNRTKNLLLSGGAMGLGFLATAGYWMMFLWRHFDNPLFPYFNKIFRSPFYLLKNFTDTRFLPKTPGEILFYPFYFLKMQHLPSELPFRDSRLAVGYLSVLLFAFVFLYRKMTAKQGAPETGPEVSCNTASLFTIVFSVSAYALWQKMFSIYRYAVPLEFLSPVIAMLTLKYIFRSRRRLMLLALPLLALVIVTTRPMSWGRVPWTRDFFGVSISALDRPEMKLGSALVLMAGHEPLSYVIPYFPPATRFVRIESILTYPGDGTLIQQRAKVLLQGQNGPEYFLYKMKGHQKDHDLDRTLSYYRRKFEKTACEPIQSKIDDDLFLCKVSPFVRPSAVSGMKGQTPEPKGR